MSSITNFEPAESGEAVPNWLALVRQKIEGLRYGVVQLVVHDGRVTQIERTEKIRLPATRGADASE
jgi:hypothetical protein